MKTSSYILAGIIGASAALCACSDNWEQPAMNLPEFPEGVEANITLAELKADYWQGTDSYGTIIGCNDNGDSLIVVGTVVSNASAGNIYKTLVLQDSTAAITIGVDTTAVSAAYPMGARLAINVTGLCIGRYSGLMQLGHLEGSGVNRITMPELRPHVKMSFKNPQIDTIVTTIPELLEASRSTEGNVKWQSRLVRLNGVTIAEAGQPFTNGNTTSRYLVDEEGNRIILYNSSYADFAYDTMPYGKGDVVAILSCYRSSWQLLLNDASGLIDFDGEGQPDTPLTPSTPEGDGTAANPYNAAAANDAAAAGSTAEVYVKGIISEISEIDTGTYGNATYYISDPDSYTRLYIYRGYGLGGKKFTSVEQLEVGKEVLIKGKLTTYNGTPQIAQGSEIVKYDGQGDDPVPTPEVADIMLNGTSADGAAGWTLTSDKWEWQSYNGNYYLNISCQNDPQAEDLYAISPEIDLATTGYTSMEFSHAAKFQTSFKEKCHIAVRESGSETWTVMPYTGYPGTDSWTFVKSGSIDITAFAGKKIQVAFVYGAGCTDKWEVNNLTFSK